MYAIRSYYGLQAPDAGFLVAVERVGRRARRGEHAGAEREAAYKPLHRITPCRFTQLTDLPDHLQKDLLAELLRFVLIAQSARGNCQDLLLV